MRRFGIMGEAVKRMETEFKNENSHINWKGIAGMRDVIIHDYDGIFYELIWKIILNELPVLQPQLSELLSQYEEE